MPGQWRGSQGVRACGAPSCGRRGRRPTPAIADRWVGQRNAVVLGAVSMSAGHIVMATDQTFLLALLLLVVGSGFLKGQHFFADWRTLSA
jgi:hypothetical protein